MIQGCYTHELNVLEIMDRNVPIRYPVGKVRRSLLTRDDCALSVQKIPHEKSSTHGLMFLYLSYQSTKLPVSNVLMVICDFGRTYLEQRFIL